MARFEGIPFVTGIIDSVCIYKMRGQYFMRSSSSLTGERVKKDPAFRKTMEYAALLTKAEIDVLEWLQHRYTPQEVDLFCKILDEGQASMKVTETEEQIARFQVRRNRRLLRILREGDYSILYDHPPDRKCRA